MGSNNRIAAAALALALGLVSGATAQDHAVKVTEARKGLFKLAKVSSADAEKTALGRYPAGQIKRGFSYTLDPDFCCYIVRFLGPEGETLLEQEECFNCVHVGVQPETWGHVKNHYR